LRLARSHAREDEADVERDQRQQVLDGVARVLLQEVLDHLANGRVLAHQHRRVLAAQREADLRREGSYRAREGGD
jgi:hypothetical protein